MIDLSKADSYIESHAVSLIEDELARLVAIPSIAAQNLRMPECADLVASLLQARSFTTEIMPTAGAPVVYGEASGQSDKTLLCYIHYDVQPADPLELWDSDPWTLTRREDKFYGRGISDDKGTFAVRLLALDAIREANGGQYPVNIKFLVEGEEEIGSIHLPEFIESHKEKLAADACVWEYGEVAEDGRFVNYLGMRGICYVELRVRTASHDAHSGILGSTIPNAAWRLTWALSTLKDQNERILIPGYYDNVGTATERDMELFATMPDIAADLMRDYELRGFVAGLEGGVELLRHQVFEPTCTISGITTGYQGEGTKTVIPSEARAKIDFRLVPDQSPEEVLEKLRAHLDAQGFDDVEIVHLAGGNPARIDPDTPFIQVANQTAEEVYGKPPIVAPMIGGSGPIYPFTHTLGVPVTMCGIAYPGRRAHAPNENFVLDYFLKSARHLVRIIDGFSKH